MKTIVKMCIMNIQSGLTAKNQTLFRSYNQIIYSSGFNHALCIFIIHMQNEPTHIINKHEKYQTIHFAICSDSIQRSSFSNEKKNVVNVTVK